MIRQYLVEKQIFVHLESEGTKKKFKILRKIAFKSMQMKSLAMHITNLKKKCFNIFAVGNLLNILMEHDLNILMTFGIK